MKLFRYLFIALLGLTLASCSSIGEMKRFSKCHFEFQKVDSLSLAGIDVSQVTNEKELATLMGAKLLVCLFQKNMPLSMNVKFLAENPSSKLAHIDGFDYILSLDGDKIITGTMDKPLSVDAKEQTLLSVPFSINIYDAIKNSEKSNLLNFLWTVAGQTADYSRIKVSIKPYYSIGSKIHKWPTYFSFSGDKLASKRK